jgi:uncharacterized protein (TIGR02145 family)
MKSLININLFNEMSILIKRSITLLLGSFFKPFHWVKVHTGFSMISLLSVILFSPNVAGQITSNDSCHNALPFCGSGLYSFAAGVSPGFGSDAQSGPDYGCLSSQPNPAWYFMEISTSGNIIIQMQSTPLRDIDFICWGPYTSPTSGCSTGLTTGKIVDCSYSSSSIEVCSIPNSIAGSFYMLCITNYSNLACNITFSQTNFGDPGAGSTNCDIVKYCSITSLSATPGSCNPVSGKFNVSGVIEFANNPTAGQLTITDVTAIPPISQTFSAPFTSPKSYLLSNIPCDGLVHTLSAAFSDSASCTYSRIYTASSTSCPQAVISGGGSICNNGTDQAIVTINFTQGSPPFNFTYALNGIPKPPISNYSGPFPFQLSTSVPGAYTLVSISNAFCPGAVSGSAVVVLNSLPVPTITGPGTVCSGSVGNIYTTEPGMTNYVWNVSPGGLITSGGTVSSNTATISWNTPGAKSVMVGYTNATMCTSATQTVYAVTVHPLLPASVGITAVPPGAICSGTSVTFTATPTNGGTAPTYQWKNGGVNVPGATGPVYTTSSLINADVITAEMISDATPCLTNSPATSNSITTVILQAPSPTIAGVDPTCAGTTTNLYSTQPGMTNYSWSISAGGNITSGGSSADDTVTVSWLTSGSQSVSVNYTSGNGCPAALPSIFPVVVKPKPSVINLQRSYSICSNTAPNITLQSSILPASFSWTTGTVTGNLTGYSNGSGNVLNQVLTNNGAMTGTVTYSVTPVADGCSGDTVNFNVSVNPSPVVSFLPPNPSICSGQTATISLLSSTPGTTFAWTPVSFTPLMTGQLSGFGPVLIQTLTNPQPIPGTVVYTIQPTVNGCNGTPGTLTINVNPLPTVSIIACNDLNTTKNARKIILKGGRPIGQGGQFTGIGVSEINPGVFAFDPMDAGVIPSFAGTDYTVTYRYTNSFGCYNEDSRKIKVFLSNAAQGCPGIIKDVRDNSTYTTFLTGSGATTRCWMEENLNYGTALLNTQSDPQRDNCIVEKYCANNQAVQCAVSGGFYQWDELLQYTNVEGSQGICPPGWHVPSEQDWEDLLNDNQGASLAGDLLKNPIAANGFHGMMSGMQYLDQQWSFDTGITRGSMFWTSTSTNSFSAIARGINSTNQSVSFYVSSRANAFNVRCVKD